MPRRVLAAALSVLGFRRCQVFCVNGVSETAVLSSFPPEPPVAPLSDGKMARSGQGRARSWRGVSEPLPASTILRSTKRTGGLRWVRGPSFLLVGFERFCLCFFLV